ncbi:MAG: metalloprotease family protein [Putridiphycobacter sp.]
MASFKDVVQKNIMLIAAFIFLMVVYFNENIVLVLSFMGVIFLHELGHFIGMKIFNFNDRKLMYVPFFTPFLKQKTETVSQKKYLITLLLGPIPGIVIGTLLFLLYLNNQSDLLLNLSTIFLAVNIFSLIPFDPLDGGKFVEILFFSNQNRIKLYFVLISSMVFIFVGFFFELYILMAFGFLMAFKVKSFQKNEDIHQVLEDEDINYKKPYKLLTDREYWKIRQAFLDKNPKLKSLIPSSDSLWENENLLVEQVSSILKIEIKNDASIGVKILVVVVLAAATYLPVNLILTNWDTVFKPLIESSANV